MLNPAAFIQKRRAYFVDLYETSPFLMVQGAIGDRIKRDFTDGKLPEPLKLAGLYYDEQGHKGLDCCFHDYTSIANTYDLPMMIHPYCKIVPFEETVGHPFEGRDISADSVAHVRSIVDGYPGIRDRMLIGTRLLSSGDPYDPKDAPDAEGSYRFHLPLAMRLDALPMDHCRTGMMRTLEEAIGAARALSETTLPYMVSLLLRQDGTLMDGNYLHDALEVLDRSVARKPLFYMSNCVHPLHLAEALSHPRNDTALVRARFKGLEGNGTTRAPGQADDAPGVTASAPDEWAEAMMALHERFGLCVLGGCCGTAHAHIDALCRLARAKIDQSAL